MNMKLTALVASMLSIVGCDDHHYNRNYQQGQSGVPIYQQNAYPTDYQPQQQYQAPVQSYAPAPVIINQQPTSSSDSGAASFLTGAALGAAAGHLLTKESNTANAQSSTHIDRPVTSEGKGIAPATQAVSPTTVSTTPQAKTNYMDTSKFGKVEPSSKPLPATTSKFDTSKFGSTSARPAVSLSKPSSGMNMSAFGRSGKR